MKLILAIVSADAVDPVSNALLEQKYAVTHISSMGGFLRRGNSTLVIGVDESRVQDALAVIRNVCGPLSKSDAHAATIFVLNAAQFVQF
jgi:uncharacterized protein YaaQ